MKPGVPRRARPAFEALVLGVITVAVVGLEPRALIAGALVAAAFFAIRLRRMRELDRVRAALETERDLEELAATRNTTGIVYRSLGDLRRAMEEFAEAERLAAEAGAGILRASVLANQGAVYAQWNLPDKAIETYERVDTLLADTGAPTVQPRSRAKVS